MRQPLPALQRLERGERRQRCAGVGTDEERAALLFEDHGDDGVAAWPEPAVRGFPKPAQPLVGREPHEEPVAAPIHRDAHQFQAGDTHNQRPCRGASRRSGWYWFISTAT